MKSVIKSAFLATLPVLSGYLVLGFGFGLVMKGAGLGVFPTLAMSALIYAGSMQFVAVGLFLAGASFFTVAITTRFPLSADLGSFSLTASNAACDASALMSSCGRYTVFSSNPRPTVFSAGII